MTIGQVILLVVQALITILAITTGFAYLTFFERRLLAKFQIRVGPNRAGPDGWLQPAADAIKLMFKEDLVPMHADKVLFWLAPAMATLPALVLFAVMPLGKPFQIGDTVINLTFADINIGILYILAITSIAVYGITIGGWASNSKYSMLGGIRASAQMISYELALAFALIVPVMLAATRLPDGFGTLSLNGIMAAQMPTWFGFIPKWFIFHPTGFLAFCVFVLAGTAETTRSPFDLVEAEQELVGGFNTEYSSMKFALFFMAEYIKLIAISALGVTLFLGGWHVPGLETMATTGWEGILGAVLSLLVFLVKLAFMLFLSIWIRATLPRFRYDQLMNIGWKRLLPFALANMVATAVLVVLWDVFVTKG